MAAGSTGSDDLDVVGFHGNVDAWLIKLDSNGIVEWQRCSGGSGVEEIRSIRQTMDNGYVAIGYTTSSDGDVAVPIGISAIWVIRFDALGNILWERTYGGSGGQKGWRIEETSNGDFNILAESTSTDGPMTDNHSENMGMDIWFARLAANGDLLWSKCLGGTGADSARDMVVLASGDILLVGITNSFDGDIIGYHEGGPSRPPDTWLVKVDQSGEVLWQLCLGGSGRDTGQGITVGSDGKIYIASNSLSTDGDITAPLGNWDYWIARVSADGVLEDQRSFGGSSSDQLAAIAGGMDNSLYITGGSPSIDGDVGNPQGGSDVWTIKLDLELNLIWERSFGGSSGDSGWGIKVAPNGSVALAGTSSSVDGDLTGNNGLNDLWVVKLESEFVGINDGVALFNLTIYPNPATTELHIGLIGTTSRQLEVVDVTGRIVITQAITSGTTSVGLSIVQLAQGTYSVRLVGDGQYYSDRFIKY